MKKLKIVLVSSVLAIGLGQTAHAVYTQDHLVALQELVNSGDTRAVLAYIQANPELMNGTDPLADALRDFVSSRQGFMGNLFGQQVPNIDGVPDLPPGMSSDVAFDTGSLSDFGS